MSEFIGFARTSKYLIKLNYELFGAKIIGLS